MLCTTSSQKPSKTSIRKTFSPSSKVPTSQGATQRSHLLRVGLCFTSWFPSLSIACGARPRRCCRISCCVFGENSPVSDLQRPCSVRRHLKAPAQAGRMSRARVWSRTHFSISPISPLSAATLRIGSFNCGSVLWSRTFATRWQLLRSGVCRSRTLTTCARPASHRWT
eukprot:Amastigsp_a176908_10.p2 type:complete len:168 gc:universal Amastigsp_a176908_10:738-235(-)